MGVAGLSRAHVALIQILGLVPEGLSWKDCPFPRRPAMVCTHPTLFCFASPSSVWHKVTTLFPTLSLSGHTWGCWGSSLFTGQRMEATLRRPGCWVV
jgi:hypothetical protein